MLLDKIRLAVGGSLAALALAGAAILAVPTSPIAAEEGRNEGIPAQAEGRAAPATGTLFAVVGANGSLARGSGVADISPGKLIGDYIVKFKGSVTGCAYSATIGLPGRSGVAAPGFITVVGSNNSANSVYVSTYNLNAVSATRGFHLVVTCPN